MKSSKQIILISIVIGFGLFNNLGAIIQAYSDEEKKVWQLEEKYWEYWIKKDIEGYLSLLHEDFLGWPDDVAVVHFFIIGKDKDGNPVGSRYRITHTWMKQGGKWQVIGGMSSVTNDKIDKN